MKLADRILAFVGRHQTATVLDLVNHILVDPLRLRQAVHELAKAEKLFRVAGHGDEALYVIPKIIKLKTPPPPSRKEKTDAFEYLRQRSLRGDHLAGVAMQEWSALAKECARLRREAGPAGGARG